MGIKVKVDLTGVNNKVVLLKQRKQEALTRMVLKDSTPYVPKDTNELRNSGQVRGNSVVWTAPHANVVYHKPMNYKTPGTTHMWLNKAKSIHIKDWIRELERS